MLLQMFFLLNVTIQIKQLFLTVKMVLNRG